MAAALSEGAVRRMTAHGKQDGYHPILQVINIKMVTTGPNERYRAILSDGTNYVQGMLATQLNPHVLNDELKMNSIIKVIDFMSNLVAGKTVIIVLKTEIIQTNAPKIGNPTEVSSTASVGAQPQQPVAQPLYGAQAPPLSNSTNYGAAAQPQVTAQKTGSPARANRYGSPGSNPYGSRPSSSHSAPIVRDPGAHQAITAIANLNMYNNRWTIRARLTSKSDIRTWNNAKGEGTLFSIELLDSSGMDIRATFFKEAVDKFYPMLQVGKVYRFSGGKLKVANMKFNSCKSQYEITFDQNSEIHLDNDAGDIKSQNYNLVKIAQVENVAENSYVDVLAIVKHVQDPVSLISKKTGQELLKCDCTLVDDSGVEITMTFWGEKARRITSEFAGCPVVAFRRARVSDYGGKCLSAGDGVEVNPPHITEASALMSWWQSAGQAAAARSLTSTNGGGGGKMDSLSERKPISTIKEEGLGHAGADKADWLSFKGFLTFVKKDKEGGAWYTACPNVDEPCKNRFKVTQTPDNGYYCEKCQQNYPTCVRRWIFAGVVDDDTSSTWVSFFNEQAEQLLGVTADEIFSKAYDGGHDQDAYESCFARANFTEWVFKCKVKSELVNEEQRVKTSVISMFPLDYVKESRDLLTEIGKF